MSTRKNQEIRTKARFLDRYQLDDSWYLRPTGTKTLGVIGGLDQVDGERVLVKLWRRISEDASELREIWAHEIRQLHRIAGTVGASDLIVPLKESGEVGQGFYLVQSMGAREPLGRHLSTVQRGHWLNLIRRPQNRVLLWMNIRRIASALEILHTQGVLHRSLDAWAVFTDAQTEPDFQLGGFEWSMRVTEESVRRPKGSRSARRRAYVSFLDDWHDLGVLVARLLRIDLSADGRSVAQDISSLTSQEREVIRRLLSASAMRHLDHATIASQIGAAIQELETSEFARSARMLLVCNLAATSPVSQAIVRASGDVVIGVGEVAAQLDFVLADLGDRPLLLELRARPGRTEKRLALQGSHLTYHLQEFKPADNRPASWGAAFCGKAFESRVRPFEIAQQRVLPSGSIEVATMWDANRRYTEIRQTSRRWDQALQSSLDESGREFSGEAAQHRGMVLLQMLEALLTEAKVWPAEIVMNNSQGQVHIAPRRDPQRDQLALTLGLDPPAKQMRDLFERDDAELDSAWTFTADNSTEDDQGESHWRLMQVDVDAEQRPLYRFEGEDPVPISNEILVKPSDFSGGVRLLRRHAKALRVLRDHQELLGVLQEPRRYLRLTREHVHKDEAFFDLDADKQEAFSEAWETLPIYFIQGPPGVGKTRLVREIVAQYVRHAAPSRLLLTAQSHHAVDHLLHEVISSPVMESVDPAPVVIRCRPKDSDGGGRLDLAKQAAEITQTFSVSGLVRALPARLRSRVLHAADDAACVLRGDQLSTPALKAAEALVLRSANLVFSTTNSGDLERIVDERGQFDLSVVEEAAKATGVELVAPLLLSHKRIAIGDHQQLPPFDQQTLDGLLASPSRLHDALVVGWPIIAQSFRFASLEDVADRIIGMDEDQLSDCAAAAARLLNFFGSVVDRELNSATSSSITFVRRLETQHRMHPVIARVVSNAFYDGKLETHPRCQKRYATQPPPFRYEIQSKLTQSPVLFIDVPYSQTAIGDYVAEQTPPYHNPTEVAAVVEILAQLVPEDSRADSRPSLAVLSPYREQVRRLKQAVFDSQSRLGHLAKFGGGEEAVFHVGTVDSFQGSEADVVIVSLVRNNHRYGGRGLGFLRDKRRMNVLLSRAKWQLVLVSSYDFLRACLPGVVDGSGGDAEFLRMALNEIDKLCSETVGDGLPAACRIPLSAVLGEVHDR